MNCGRRRRPVARNVVFAPEAEDDLLKIYDFIADRANPERAYAYVERIRSYCLAFDAFPERGVRRDELRPGLRIVGFEHRVTIAFHVTPTLVIIDRVLYGGRDVEGLVADG
jgi:toxin ParE1/3/4